MEIINNSPETSDNEEEDNVSQAREVPPQNAEEQEVASKPKKAKKRKAKKSNQDERKPKALTSDCWTYFDKVGFVDGVESAKCKGCGKLLSAASTGGTTHLNRHKDSCMKSIKYHDVGDMMIGAEGKLRKKKFDPKANRELLAKLVITHGAPFNIVEWKVFRDYQKFLNDDCIFVTRNTISKDVLKVYGDEKQKLKSQLAQIRGRVCLTSDCWTACTNEGFISLTAHYVDLNWKLQNKILAFAHMEPPHTGRELALKVLEMLSDWGIEKKVFSITLDNASANDSMQNFLKEHLGISNSLLLKGEYFHIRCSAHVLNLIVQDGLKTISDALHKIRQSITYVRVTESRTLAFFECAKNIGDIDTAIGLRTDCVTRWNSTYTMLHSAINYRRAFYSLSLRDSNFKCCPTSVEWRRAETLCDLLKPFFNITNLISGSSYPTSNLYFGEIWKIECLLRSYLRSEDPLIQTMTKKMKEKFDKYWSEYSVILAFATILDPTKKLNFVRYAYSKLDPVTSEDKSKNVKIMLEKLFAEYVNNEILSSNPSSSQQMVQPPLGRGPLPSVDEEFEEFENQETTVIGKTELDTYLDELRMPSSTCFDILTYWKERSRKSPTLARIACDILSIPITTVASESAFSIGARVLTKYRSSMKDESVQALMCARSWLHGFEELGDVNNNDKDDESHESVQASNSVEYVNID
ncbi:unnamed protein product [Trifolium pratense]|uniref:Uncharacterized protein n=1 Tax=Trifolium pratense TaxID=57577 RepID=A0ACB0MBE5_TRIPR|nr:unnamed protein product [Trifolium pratense]